jgi:polyferredoxin/Na+-translocating ferredoxin:NAD+ oxidoreductase RnfG subunit
MQRLLICLVFALGCQPLQAETESTNAPLSAVISIFPSADVVKPKSVDLAAQAVYGGDTLLGYVFFIDELFPIPAYSGRPIRALVGVDSEGIIRGLQIVSHDEPILVIGVSDEDLANYIDQYAGLNGHDRVKIGDQQREGYTNIDGISGATITAMVLHRSIMESARKVIVERQLGSLELPAEPEPPIWLQNWQEKSWQILVLFVGLAVLVVVLFFQDWMVVHTRVFKVLRIAFLFYTLIFIGFICLAQLSIVNVLTFAQVLARGFSWDTFLVDPVIFVLWSFVAFSLLLWGRGVYCGWLCPFGALQELIHKLSTSLKLKRFQFPTLVHERLWAVKYLILMGLLGMSLNSITSAVPFIEIEPFKTVFALRFNREWEYVLYAVTVIALAFVNTKFYCKYICPLGAALSIGTKFRIFEWLRRRKECGSPCHTCANECSVGAIRSTGEIIENECHYCLECQATYWDEHKCPSMVSQRERRERRERRVKVIPVTEVPSDATAD